MKVSLGMEETKEMLRLPEVVVFLRMLYSIANNLNEITHPLAHPWPIVTIEVVFTSPCEVNSMEVTIYEPQLETIGYYFELVMRQHYNDFRVTTVKVLDT